MNSPVDGSLKSESMSGFMVAIASVPEPNNIKQCENRYKDQCEDHQHSLNGIRQTYCSKSSGERITDDDCGTNKHCRRVVHTKDGVEEFSSCNELCSGWV